MITEIKKRRINVVGAGLAGCEASHFLASHGFIVDLFEKRPKYPSPAHHSDLFGELVCSNSLKSKRLDNACGLLKEEIKMMGSLVMEASEKSAVGAGESLSVDRDVFAKYLTEKIKSDPNIIIHEENVTDFPKGKTIICTGPLTDQALLDAIAKKTGERSYGFFDASAPIVLKSSIDMSKVYLKNRYDKGEGAYIDCPMDKECYIAFVEALCSAKKTLLHDFDTEYFEGCLPVEVIASRGVDSLRYGPLKPVGLEENGKTHYAVVQLRQDDLLGDLYNMVGFQTNLTYPEQKRVFRMIPGLENAEFVRYGLMHRNSYLYAPKVLDDRLRLKVDPSIYIGGQLSGVEGYVESAATGLLAAYYAYFDELGISYEPISYFTVLGSLLRYITHTGVNNFQPMNANFGIVYKANSSHKDQVIARSMEGVADFLKQVPSDE
jgi:methylenetetrahydrofolate--tRNA-(uracil-5-)-methyltransferase